MDGVDIVGGVRCEGLGCEMSAEVLVLNEPLAGKPRKKVEASPGKPGTCLGLASIWQGDEWNYAGWTCRV